MNFFEAQDKARRRTKWLVAYFVCAVISIVGSVYLGVAIAMNLAGSLPVLWDPNLFFFVAGVTLLLILGGTAYKSIELIRGGRSIAEAMGGRPVQPNSGDYKERQLLNIVEEMVNMIQTQRAYEINSRAISTSDEMLARLSQL